MGWLHPNNNNNNTDPASSSSCNSMTAPTRMHSTRLRRRRLPLRLVLLPLLLAALFDALPTSAARGYSSYVCQPNEYRCRAGNCIPSERRCDGVPDCPDRDDEDASCRYNNNTCLENLEFACRNGDCIPIESVCDGAADCQSREDEDYSLCNCSSDKWRCLRGGGCIAKTQVCDGKRQCKDGSDESNCHFHAKYNKTRIVNECHSFQYQCADGICISAYKRCNGITDCVDGSDENNCPLNYDDSTYDFEPETALGGCDIYEFECDYSRCIPIEKKCDGYPDCDDETDELECPPFTGTSKSEVCEDSMFSTTMHRENYSAQLTTYKFKD